MVEINRIAQFFNADGSLKPADQVKTQAAEQVASPVQASVSSTEKIHEAEAPLPQSAQDALNLFQTRFTRFLKEEAQNKLDNGVPTEKSQGQNTVEALFAEIQAANRAAIESKIGNRNLLLAGEANPELPKMIGDIAALAKTKPELQKIFSDPDIRNAVLNLIGFSQAAKQVTAVYSDADKATQDKVTNLLKTVSPFQDSVHVLGAKGLAYFKEAISALEPFLDGYKDIIETHSKELQAIFKAKAPEFKAAFAKASPSAINELGTKFEELAPQISGVIEKQSTTIGKFLGGWIQKNSKSIFGLAANAAAAVKNIFEDVVNTTPGAKETPLAKKLAELN